MATTVTFKRPDGQNVQGYLAEPEHASGAAAVVSTLRLNVRPPMSSAKSVKVPPISTARRADVIYRSSP